MAEGFALASTADVLIDSLRKERLPMTDFIATYRPMPPLTPEDRTYIEQNFYTMEELCLGRSVTPDEYRSQIREGLLPLPAYLMDEIEMYPGDFFVFPDSVGRLGRMKEEFTERYVAAAAAYGGPASTEQAQEEYTAYLSGEYGACLRSVSPESIFLKEFALTRIRTLLDAPNPGDVEWSARLRTWVNRLDSMEREFAPCDTARFGCASSRERYIDRARQEFPTCFSSR
jgi:hypothetical protein